ncbi:hypothetical protein J6590_037119 [Homalodisca vitripennis]|nr:hypothetical protein J6590_037119 [Homalodisca vitripennis]
MDNFKDRSSDLRELVHELDIEENFDLDDSRIIIRPMRNMVDVEDRREPEQAKNLVPRYKVKNVS